jgi:hydroxymethylglutaryl-CoA lyase
MNIMPKKVHITEVGPRDGLQMEKQVLDTEMKVKLIAGLVAAGLESIQVASFVHPGRMPQMADAEAVIDQLPVDGKVRFSALTLNRKGVERACRTRIKWIEVSLSASETQSRHNTGMAVEQAMQEIRPMIEMAADAGRKIRGSIQCTFDCVHPGEIGIEQIKRLASHLLDCGVQSLMLADTTGMATPLSVRRILQAILPIAGNVPLGLHLHDTRGLGLVNLIAGLEMGISHFDTSLGGLGGCPFVSGAAGNIATEDTLNLLNSLHIETGVDMGKVAKWSRQLSAWLGRELSGKMYKLLS